MDFNYSNEDEAFRQEFRAWLDQNLQFAVPALGPLADEEEVSWEATLQWHRKLYEGGWLGITWPTEYGGRGATLLQEIICDQELEQAGSGVPFTGAGIWLLGPTLIHWGTDRQKHRHLRTKEPGITPTRFGVTFVRANQSNLQTFDANSQQFHASEDNSCPVSY